MNECNCLDNLYSSPIFCLQTPIVCSSNLNLLIPYNCFKGVWIHPSQRRGPKVVFGALADWYHLVGKSVSAVGYEINNHNFPLSLALPRRLAVHTMVATGTSYILMPSPCILPFYAPVMPPVFLVRTFLRPWSFPQGRKGTAGKYRGINGAGAAPDKWKMGVGGYTPDSCPAKRPFRSEFYTVLPRSPSSNEPQLPMTVTSSMTHALWPSFLFHSPQFCVLESSPRLDSCIQACVSITVRGNSIQDSI